jgi:hypothetical protein
MADDVTPSPYDEFVTRSGRWCKRLRRWRRRHPTGSWIQIGLLVVTTIYATVTYRLLDSANRTHHIANQQLEATDRAWITIELAMPSPSRIVNNSAAFFPQWTLHNIGRSIATEAYNEWSPYVEPFSEKASTEPLERQKETCTRADQPDRIRSGQVLFPNEAKGGTGSFTVDPATLRDAQAKSPNGMATSIVLTGCVGYRYPTSTRRHHTGFIYLLRHYTQPGLAVQLTPEWLFSAPLQPGAVVIETFFFGSPPVD